MNSRKEFGELRAALEGNMARLDGLMAAFDDYRAQSRKWQDDILEEVRGRLDNHAGRLRSLELWKAGIVACLALLAAIWGLFRFAWENLKRGG